MAYGRVISEKLQIEIYGNIIQKDNGPTNAIKENYTTITNKSKFFGNFAENKTAWIRKTQRFPLSAGIAAKAFYPLQ